MCRELPRIRLLLKNGLLPTMQTLRTTKVKLTGSLWPGGVVRKISSESLRSTKILPLRLALFESVLERHPALSESLPDEGEYTASCFNS